MLEPRIDWTARTHEELRARFAHRIPQRLNVARAALDHEDVHRLALVDVDAVGEPIGSWTFAEIADRVKRMANVLAARGVARGDRVAVFLRQRVDNPVAHLAAFELGAVSVPLAPLFRTDALMHRLRTSGASVVVTEPVLREHLVGLDLPLTVLDCEHGLAEELAAAPATFETTDTVADDPAMLVFTSGTAGPPKGVLHAHRFVPARLGAFELIHRLAREPSADEPFYTPADWAWIAGLVDSVLTPWTLGCPVLAHRRDRFDAAQMLRVIARHRARALFVPPTALKQLARVPGTERPELAVRTVHSAGEPLSESTLASARELFGEVHELYGMTEMGALVGSSPLVPTRGGSMGKPYPGQEVVLLDDARELVEGPGEGEIAVRRDNPGLMLGYLRDETATAARFHGEWFLTGDRASRDTDGYLAYTGRDDDLFNTSGYRVGPTEIETCLERHPAVRRAAVVGVPDADRGHVVKAFVTLEPGPDGPTPTRSLAANIRLFVKTRLAAYEYPRMLVFAHDLPLTVTGKLRRSALRAQDADARWGISGVLSDQGDSKETRRCVD